MSGGVGFPAKSGMVGGYVYSRAAVVGEDEAQGSDSFQQPMSAFSLRAGMNTDLAREPLCPTCLIERLCRGECALHAAIGLPTIGSKEEGPEERLFMLWRMEKTDEVLQLCP